jgi:hypothetical protein
MSKFFFLVLLFAALSASASESDPDADADAGLVEMSVIEPDAGTPENSLLRGQVFSKGTRDPVPTASIWVDDAGTPIQTDGDGRFELWLPPGSHQVLVRASKHQQGSFTETLEPRQQVDVSYRLVRELLNPYETVVRG